jgi:hypothetical protein
MSETRTGQQVAQLHDRYVMMMLIGFLVHDTITEPETVNILFLLAHTMHALTRGRDGFGFETSYSMRNTRQRTKSANAS